MLNKRVHGSWTHDTIRRLCLLRWILKDLQDYYFFCESSVSLWLFVLVFILVLLFQKRQRAFSGFVLWCVLVSGGCWCACVGEPVSPERVREAAQTPAQSWSFQLWTSGRLAATICPFKLTVTEVTPTQRAMRIAGRTKRCDHYPPIRRASAFAKILPLLKITAWRARASIVLPSKSVREDAIAAYRDVSAVLPNRSNCREHYCHIIPRTLNVFINKWFYSNML